MPTCTTGPCWTATTINGNFQAECAGSFNNLWLVGGVNTLTGNAVVQYSNDGTIWTSVDLGYLGGIGVKSFAVGNGTVLGQIGGRTHVISTNGTSWSVEDHYFGGLPTIFGGGYFVMRGGVVNDSLVYSASGTTGSWNFTDSAAGSGSYMNRALTYGNGLYVGVGGAGFCYTNNIETPLTLVPYTTLAAGLLAYGNGVFVAIETGLGAANAVFRSTDGVNWTTIPNALPSSGSGQTYYNSLIFAQDRFLACKSDSNTLIYSTDGLTWTLTSGDSLFDSEPSVGQLYMATDGNGLYMAVNPFNTSAQVGVCPCSTPITYGDWWARLSNVVVSNVSVRKATKQNQFYTSVLYPEELEDIISIQSPQVNSIQTWEILNDTMSVAIPAIQNSTLITTISYVSYENAIPDVLTAAVPVIQGSTLVDTIAYKTYENIIPEVMTVGIPSIQSGTLVTTISYITYDNTIPDIIRPAIPAILGATLQ